ncbi:MAG: DUF1559 domain-containing protein, partial [Planctomycetaceae bacterium]
MARAGFTKIELLVAVSIIAVLVSLITPAVQQARESMRRRQCASNLHEIGTAIHAYEAVHQQFPPGSQPPDARSLHVVLLPYIEQQPLFDRYRELGGGEGLKEISRSRISLYLCPSDSAPDRLPSGRALTSYSGNCGTWAHGFNGMFQYLVAD